MQPQPAQLYEPEPYDAPRVQPYSSYENLLEMNRSDFVARMLATWGQGEHVASIGPTGSGKSTITREILPARDFVVIVAVKKRDDTLELYKKPYGGRPGFQKITKWPPRWNQRRVILHLPPGQLGTEMDNRETLLAALQDVYATGGWTVVFDDMSYIAISMKLRDQLITLMNQGRSSKITNVSNVNRPVKVVGEVLTQQTWTLAFPFEDERDVDRIAEIAGMPHARMRLLMRGLSLHDFVAHRRAADGVGAMSIIVRNGRNGRVTGRDVARARQQTAAASPGTPDYYANARGIRDLRTAGYGRADRTAAGAAEQSDGTGSGPGTSGGDRLSLYNRWLDLRRAGQR